MKKFLDDKSGQLILVACVAVAAAIILITVYEISAMSTGEKSIYRENENSYYFYESVRERYSKIFSSGYLNSKEKDYTDLSNPNNITVFEKEFKEFAILHGYSLDIKRNGTQARLIFIDKNLIIDEVIRR